MFALELWNIALIMFSNFSYFSLLSFYLSIYWPIHLSIHLPVHPSILPSFHLCILSLQKSQETLRVLKIDSSPSFCGSNTALVTTIATNAVFSPVPYSISVFCCYTTHPYALFYLSLTIVTSGGQERYIHLNYTAEHNVPS